MILIPLGLGLAASGGALMARKALEPVDRMSRSARRITAEGLSRRLELRGTGDELDRLADTLNEMLGRLEGAFGAMRRFSADAAHELRTPLTALKGGLEVALRAERSPAEYRQVLAAKLEEVDRLIRLAEDLLFVGRSGADLASPRAPVDLEQVALEVLDVGARLAQPRGVTVRMEVADAVTVLGHASALHRAARNLVENAVNYTPAGGLVEVNVARDNGSGLLSVRDTGPGIAPGDVTRVFEPFVRLDAARDRASGAPGSVSPSRDRSLPPTAARSRWRRHPVTAAASPFACRRSGERRGPSHRPRHGAGRSRLHRGALGVRAHHQLAGVDDDHRRGRDRHAAGPRAGAASTPALAPERPPR